MLVRDGVRVAPAQSRSAMAVRPSNVLMFDLYHLEICVKEVTMKTFFAALGAVFVAFGIAKLVLALWQQRRGRHG